MTLRSCCSRQIGGQSFYVAKEVFGPWTGVISSDTATENIAALSRGLNCFLHIISLI
jgi:hypothetical protein